MSHMCISTKLLFWLFSLNLLLYRPWSLALQLEVAADVNLKLSSTEVRGSLRHFWKSTGFCPPLPHQNAANFDLSEDMQQNLAYVGALPFEGVRQVRVHWLFDLVKVEKLTRSGPVYDFHFLDEFISLLSVNGLVPGFEFMGNPSGIFSDFENSTQVYWWRDLVKQTAQRYVDKYGINAVKEWNFETWNEPNNHKFDNLTISVQGFLNYYDACSEGLKAVDASLRLGGLGDSSRDLLKKKPSKKPKYSRAFFNHVIRGKNYFTGEAGVRLDFIALHEKGHGQGSLVLTEEKMIMEKMQSLFPELMNKPLYNDEADPLVHWSEPLTWRATAVYASESAKIIAQHQNIVVAHDDSIIKNFSLLSNDNGFLSYYPHQFTQRTLLARFQMNTTSPHYVTFIRKPIYSLLSLMALMGNKQIHVEATDSSGIRIFNSSDVGVLASIHQPAMSHVSSDCWQMTLLVFRSTDPMKSNGSNRDLRLDITWMIDPPTNSTDLKMMIYLIYNSDDNPFDVWTNKFQSVAFPSLDQLTKIREHEDPPGALWDVPAKKGRVHFPWPLSLKDPHVLFMHLCAKARASPEKVSGVRFMNVTHGQVMIVWNDFAISSRCLLTYEVELSTKTISGPYVRVNRLNSIITTFLFETDTEIKVRGYYRVRAVDYWNRGGKYSDPMRYPSGL